MSEENKSKFTPGRIALGAAGVLVIGVIILLAIGKISVAPSGDDDKAATTQFSEGATETAKEEKKPTEEASEESDKGQPEEDSSRPDDAVEDPEMGDPFEAEGEVIDKYVTSSDKQYQYVLKVRVSNDSGSRDLEYISTKKAYEGVNEGDKFKVTYSGDSEGNIAVESIAPAE